MIHASQSAGALSPSPAGLSLTHTSSARSGEDTDGAGQRELNIEEGSYILGVKNPALPTSRGAGLNEARQADCPTALQERFRGRLFSEVAPPNLLTCEGAEVLLSGASEDVLGELGVPLHPHRETMATAAIFKDLRMGKSRHSMKPLFEGAWE